MTIKKELIKKLEELASQYLHFDTGLAGLSGNSKAELESRVADYEKMIEFQRQADEISRKWGNGQKLYFSHFSADVDSECRRDYKEYTRLNYAASEIWHGKSAERAIETAEALTRRCVGY